jgi:hypothetical protein
MECGRSNEWMTAPGPVLFGVAFLAPLIAHEAQHSIIATGGRRLR